MVDRVGSNKLDQSPKACVAQKSGVHFASRVSDLDAGSSHRSGADLTMWSEQAGTGPQSSSGLPWQMAPLAPITLRVPAFMQVRTLWGQCHAKLWATPLPMRARFDDPLLGVVGPTLGCTQLSVQPPDMPNGGLAVDFSGCRRVLRVACRAGAGGRFWGTSGASSSALHGRSVRRVGRGRPEERGSPRTSARQRAPNAQSWSRGSAVLAFGRRC